MDILQLKTLPTTANELTAKIEDVFINFKCIEDGNGYDCFGWTFLIDDSTVYDLTICFNGEVVEKFFHNGVVSQQETHLLNVEQVMYLSETYDKDNFEYLIVTDGKIDWNW